MTTKPGLFENSSLDFNAPVTVVNGKNGSGKSFMARCLIESLWKPVEAPRLLWKSAWDAIFFDLSVDIPGENGDPCRYRFTHNGQQLSIACENGEIRELISHEGESTRGIIDEVEKRDEGRPLSGFWRGINLEAYINSSFVPSPSDLETEEVINFDTIKEMILNDRSGFYVLSHELKSRFSLRGEGGRLLHLTEKLEQEQKDIQKQIELIEIRGMRSAKLEKELALIKDEQENLRVDQAKYAEDIARLSSVISSLKEVETLNGRLEEIRSEVETEQAHNRSVKSISDEIKNNYPQFQNLKIPDDSNLDRLQELFRDIRNLNEAIDTFFTRRDEKRGKMRRIATGVNIAVLIAVGTIFYKNNFSLKEDHLLIGSLLGVALVFSPVSSIYSFFSTRNRKLQKLKMERQELEERLKSFLRESNLILEDYRLSELFEFLLQYFEEYIEYIEKIRERDEIKEKCLSAGDLKVLKEDLKELKSKQKEIKAAIARELQSLETADPVEEDAEIVEQAMTRLGKAVERLEGDIAAKERVAERIAREISLESDEGGNLVQLKKKAAAVTERLKVLRRRRKAAEILTDTVTEGVLRREQHLLTGLVCSALERFHDITDGHYRENVKEQDVRELLSGNGMRGEINPAVVHALILSVKLSLSEFIPETLAALPIIIDDPFLFMDDDRTKKLKKQIDDIARSRQVIIFTHKSDISEWGNAVKL